MTDSASELPKFRNPPLSEVVVGIQFGGSNLSPVHLGLYYQRVRNRFPTVQLHPPLPPAFETFGPAPVIGFPMMMPSFSPRMWFIAADQSSLIQLQAGRLLFNWRSGPAHGTYPHFEAVRSDFLFAYDELIAMIDSEGLGDTSVDQCELVYVNPLPTDATGIQISTPEKIFRNWSNGVGSEWSKSIEGMDFNVRYRLDAENGEPFGRLTATVTSGMGPDGTTSFQLELTARGNPIGPGRDGINSFHDFAHRAIVRCFTGLTTPQMHDRWQRYQ